MNSLSTTWQRFYMPLHSTGVITIPPKDRLLCLFKISHSYSIGICSGCSEFCRLSVYVEISLTMSPHTDNTNVSQ